jgi:DNA-directed RNA polymerase beta subunit
VEECIERDMTFAAPLKAVLRLIVWEDLEDGERRPKDIIEKEVYLGDLPLLTALGTFIINGAERVVVSQLHRSPASSSRRTSIRTVRGCTARGSSPSAGRGSSSRSTSTTSATSTSTRRRSSRRRRSCVRSATGDDADLYQLFYTPARSR